MPLFGIEQLSFALPLLPVSTLRVSKFMILFIVFFFYAHTCVLSQPSSAIATLSRDKIYIGDTFSLTLRVQCRPEQQTIWPALTDTLGDFEIRQKTAIDTLQPNETGQTVLRQTLVLSTFEEGPLSVPPLKWQFINPNSGAATIVETPPLNVLVDTLSVSNQQDILPIKPPFEFPLTWRDYLPYLLAAAVGVLLLFAAFWVWKRRRRAAATPLSAAPILPPNEIALQKLRSLEKAQYWQRGNIKRYYADLSDIVREYLENRFDIPARESVTDEIMVLVHKQELLPNALQQNLQQLLTTADMVKFAKVLPPLETHIEMQTCAEQIIRQTTTTAAATPPPPASI